MKHTLFNTVRTSARSSANSVCEGVGRRTDTNQWREYKRLCGIARAARLAFLSVNNGLHLFQSRRGVGFILAQRGHKKNIPFWGLEKHSLKDLSVNQDSTPHIRTILICSEAKRHASQKA
jgi:hypothetical protein